MAIFRVILVIWAVATQARLAVAQEPEKKQGLLGKALDGVIRQAGFDPASPDAAAAKDLGLKWMNPLSTEAELKEAIDHVVARATDGVAGSGNGLSAQDRSRVLAGAKACGCQKCQAVVTALTTVCVLTIIDKNTGVPLNKNAAEVGIIYEPSDGRGEGVTALSPDGGGMVEISERSIPNLGKLIRIDIASDHHITFHKKGSGISKRLYVIMGDRNSISCDSLGEARQYVSADLKLPGRAQGDACLNCNGTGKVACFRCKGSGNDPTGGTVGNCGNCHGSGQQDCSDCWGTGSVAQGKKLFDEMERKIQEERRLKEEAAARAAAAERVEIGKKLRNGYIGRVDGVFRRWRRMSVAIDSETSCQVGDELSVKKGDDPIGYLKVLAISNGKGSCEILSGDFSEKETGLDVYNHGK